MGVSKRATNSLNKKPFKNNPQNKAHLIDPAVQSNKRTVAVSNNCEVMVENKLDKQEKFFGRTKYMNPVIFDADECKPGTLLQVKIKSYNQNNLFGIYNSKKIKAA